jgi:hypothetical protein
MEQQEKWILQIEQFSTLHSLNKWLRQNDFVKVKGIKLLKSSYVLIYEVKKSDLENLEW